jgi:hypothetical protein
MLCAGRIAIIAPCWMTAPFTDAAIWIDASREAQFASANLVWI